MGDGWVQNLLLVSATCDEILSYMIENWMKIPLVSDSYINTVSLQSLQKITGITSHVGTTFSVHDNIPWFTIGIEQDY